MRTAGLSALVLSLLFVQGCAQFADGIAAMSGKGGTIARVDEMASYRAAAAKLAAGQPRPVSIGDFPYEEADILLAVDDDRLLAGTVEVGAYLGVPDHKELIMYRRSDGAELWRSERPSLMRTNGRYSILTARPNIVLTGRDSKSTHVFLIDVDTGTKLWQAKYEGKTDLGLLPDRLVVASVQNGRLQVEARTLDSAAPLWSQSLPVPEPKDSTTSLSLTAFGESVYVLAGDLLRLSSRTGRIDWRAPGVAGGGGRRNLVPVKGGALLWHRGGLTFIRDANGRVAWRKTFDAANALKLAVPVGKRVVVVTQRPKAFDRVSGHALDSGRRRWTVGAGGLVASALLQDGGKVVYSVDDALVTLRVADGKRLRRARFPRSFIQASPARNVDYMQPDILLRRSGNTLVARDLYGILAVRDRNGKVAWSHRQPTPADTANPYTASNRYAILKISLANHNVTLEEARSPSAPAYYGVVDTQQSLQVTNSHWQAVLDDPSRGVWEKSIATDMQIANEQFAVSQGLFNAGMQLASAIGDALQQTAIQGMVSRIQEQVGAGVDMHVAGFRGDYYVRPYFTPAMDAKGVMIVSLSTGRRADILTGPALAPITAFGLDLPTLAVAGGRLTLVDINLYPDTWRDYVKGKIRIPRPSLLSYDLKSMLR